MALLVVDCSQGPMGINGAAGSVTTQSATNLYQARALAILRKNCTSCHTSSAGPAEVYDVTNLTHLVSVGLVVPGQPDQSPLFGVISSGAMPKTGALSATDKAVILNWISTMPTSTTTTTLGGTEGSATTTTTLGSAQGSSTTTTALDGTEGLTTTTVLSGT